ncbi:hypothetical protein ACF3NR_05085 [Vaginella massiliensis]|uniref:hypothetical protein n=1 Tax=Vaginella massiliensis TaxID=1816680 RepID=UPI0012B5A8AF|nr:hypothetical protein [Vaginella massiliensis]
MKKIITILCFVFIAWFLLYFLVGDTFPFDFANQNLKQLFPNVLVFLAGVAIYILLLLQINLDKKWEFSNILKFVGGIILGFIPFILYGFFSIQTCPFWLQKQEYHQTLFQSKLNQNERIVLRKTTCLDCPTTKQDTVKSKVYAGFIRTTQKANLHQLNTKYWQKISL